MAFGTPHFSPAEVGQPARHGFPAAPVPPHLHAGMQRTLIAHERIRARWAKLYPENPAVITVSGYRSEAYNRKIGGASASAHVDALALDTKPANGKIREYQVLVEAMLAAGELPEIGGRGVYDTFIHLDTRPRKAGGAIARWDMRTTPGRPDVPASAPEGAGEVREATVEPRDVAPVWLWAACLVLSALAAAIALGSKSSAPLSRAPALSFS